MDSRALIRTLDPGPLEQCMAQGLNHAALNHSAKEDEAKAARALYVDTMSNMAQGANDAFSPRMANQQL